MPSSPPHKPHRPKTGVAILPGWLSQQVKYNIHINLYSYDDMKNAQCLLFMTEALICDTPKQGTSLRSNSSVKGSTPKSSKRNSVAHRTAIIEQLPEILLSPKQMRREDSLRIQQRSGAATPARVRFIAEPKIEKQQEIVIDEDVNKAEAKIDQLDQELDSQKKILLGNKREVNLLESELSRLHRSHLIANQTTLSLVLDSIMDFEKSFLRMATTQAYLQIYTHIKYLTNIFMANEERQAQAFLQVQLSSLHRDNRVIEGQIRQVDRRTEWCKAEIGEDGDYDDSGLLPINRDFAEEM